MTDNTSKGVSMTPVSMTKMQLNTASSIDYLIKEKGTNVYSAFTLKRLMTALTEKHKKELTNPPSVNHVRDVLNIKVSEGMIYSPDGKAVYIVLGRLLVPALKHAEMSVDALVASGNSGFIVKMAEIGDQFRSQRARFGLTQVEVSEIVGVSSSTISLWESGGWNTYRGLLSILPSKKGRNNRWKGRNNRWKLMVQRAERGLKVLKNHPLKMLAPAPEPAQEPAQEPDQEPAIVGLGGIEPLCLRVRSQRYKQALETAHRPTQEPESPPATSWWVDLAKRLQAALPESVQSVSITSSGVEYVEREWVESKKTL